MYLYIFLMNREAETKTNFILYLIEGRSLAMCSWNFYHSLLINLTDTVQTKSSFADNATVAESFMFYTLTIKIYGKNFERV